MFDFIKNNKNTIIKIKLKDKTIKIKLENNDVIILPTINRKNNWKSVIYHQKLLKNH